MGVFFSLRGYLRWQVPGGTGLTGHRVTWLLGYVLVQKKHGGSS